MQQITNARHAANMERKSNAQKPCALMQCSGAVIRAHVQLQCGRRKTSAAILLQKTVASSAPRTALGGATKPLARSLCGRELWTSQTPLPGKTAHARNAARAIHLDVRKRSAHRRCLTPRTMARSHPGNRTVVNAATAIPHTTVTRQGAPK